ncbi:hypothetical protein H5410_047987 [Solanum commersonii]|uniref:Uncharacterized protein n=1 Tax=Solanum commersonii TaxID=4109 RepID=A0A9J5XGS1_SOLCO|nr:hypothetical protein H5410_047987 [Solanum commersonii]
MAVYLCALWKAIASSAMAKGETRRPFIAFVARRSSKSDAMLTMARKDFQLDNSGDQPDFSSDSKVQPIHISSPSNLLFLLRLVDELKRIDCSSKVTWRILSSLLLQTCPVTPNSSSLFLRFFESC